MGWFSKRKKKVPYIPQGRVGQKRLEYSGYGIYFTIIVEKIGEVGDRCKFKILEVSIDRDCSKTRVECLKKWGAPDWLPISYFTWETDEQMSIRLGTPMLVDPEVVTKKEDYILTPHNFVENDD